MQAEARAECRVLVIGMGNDYRSDDAVGLIVARRLRKGFAGKVTVLEASGDGTALVAAWKGADAVVLIDAVQSAGRPGTLYRLDAHAQSVPTGLLHRSTHAIDVAEAIELARALGELPPRLIVYGIEGGNFEPGVGLSPEVEQVVQEVAKLVLQEVWPTRASGATDRAVQALSNRLGSCGGGGPAPVERHMPRGFDG